METINFNNTYSYEQILKSLIDLSKNGLPTGYNMGISELDEMFRIDKGKLITLTGIPNLGKSEFTDFICTQFNKLYGFKTLFFSAEDDLNTHVAKIITKYTNKEFKNTQNEEIEKQAKYMYENFIFIDYNKVYTVNALLEEAEKQIIEQNIDILVIDPFNKLEADKDYNVNMTDYISKFLDKLLRLTKKYNIITLLVAHPKKMNEGIIPSPYDISDSAHFFNKSDYCITVHGNKANYSTIIKVDKVKYKHLGSCGQIELYYDDLSGNFYYDDRFNERKYIHKDFDMTPKGNYSRSNELLNIDVDTFNCIADVQPKQKKLIDILTLNDDEKANQIITQIRSEKDESKQKELKKNLPNYCINATFNSTRKKDNIKALTGLLYIDIDAKDNTSIIKNVPDILRNISNILFFKRSCRGSGYTAIVPYNTNLKIDDVWHSIDTDFKKLGVEIDKSTKNVDRVTFYSYDTDFYINDNVETYNKCISNTVSSNFKVSENSKNDTQKVVVNPPNNIVNNKDSYKNREYLNKLIGYLNDTKKSLDNGNYAAWGKICLALISEFKEKGLYYFLMLSQNYKGFNKDETTEFYNKYLDSYSDNNDVTFATIKHYAMLVGFKE
ncbi:BT4734/BF3469 family protein [Bacteroides faecium]|uniref:AAA family ATPase n=1 Tax=Bacteroides faecium TaxID=2715212 RepID=A0A6H0KSK1_9BACE|nr:BT4734/BF3469 family protein [Bacteroides faecium]QIU96322.1 AAA family ATPase [Bacteroides faecium]